MAAFSDLFGERLDRELGSADRTALFTTVRRKGAINEAQLEFCKQTECFTKSVSITLSDGTREYDLEAVISAADYLWIAKDGVEYVFTDADSNVTYRSGDDFPRYELSTLNREHNGWRSADDTTYPDGYYLREDGGKVYLGLKTPPDIGASESASITLPYVAVPPDMSADGDEPYTVSSDSKKSLRPWHQALVHYAAALLEPLRKNYTGEQRQRTLFAGQVADYLQRKRPKGGQMIAMGHNYYRAARGRYVSSVAQRDPRVYP